MGLLWGNNLIISIFVLLLSFGSYSQLAIKDRSEDLNRAINKGFSRAKLGGYNFYGRNDLDYGTDYFVYSHDLVKAILESAPKEQKDFYIVDIGAGYGGFNNGAAKTIKKMHLADDIHVHLIGLTAQDHVPYTKEVESLNITKYLFSNFNAENFSAKLSQLHDAGVDIQNKIDLVVSNFTFTHIIDPIGTLIQVHDNLRENTGMILLDYFSINGQLESGETTSLAIHEMLAMTNAQFVTAKVPFGDYKLRYVLIRRVGDTRLHIPFSYGPVKDFENYSSGKWPRSSYVISSTRALENIADQKVGRELSLLGSPNSGEFFDWLVQHTSIQNKTTQWKSIFVDDSTSKKHEVAKTIFDVIDEQDLSGIKSMLDADPELVNAKDKAGTPLIFKAQRNSEDVFDLVLKYNPDFFALDASQRSILQKAIQTRDKSDVEQILQLAPSLVNSSHANTKPPLTLAIASINSFSWARERYLSIAKILINAEADVTKKDSNGKAPLHYAASTKKAAPDRELIEMLIGKGADPCAADNDDLLPLDYFEHDREEHGELVKLLACAKK